MNIETTLTYTAADIDSNADLEKSLDFIDDALAETRAELHFKVLKRARQQADWWHRFISYCHTGK
jgi:hypothetical protein